MGKKFAAWKTIMREEVFSTPWMSLYHDQFEMPGGKRGNYFYMHTRGSALTIPLTDDGKVVLVKQYRYLTNEASIEFPCGGVKDGQSDEEAARAELVEEAGYECQKLKKAGRFIPYNGLSDEFCTVFIARKLRHVGADPDETEQIEVMTATPAEVDAMIQKGRIIDGMSIAGWLLGKKFVS
jgi:ADP-ribose pyrophosphatase